MYLLLAVVAWCNCYVCMHSRRLCIYLFMLYMVSSLLSGVFNVASSLAFGSSLAPSHSRYLGPHQPPPWHLARGVYLPPPNGPKLPIRKSCPFRSPLWYSWCGWPQRPWCSNMPLSRSLRSLPCMRFCWWRCPPLRSHHAPPCTHFTPWTPWPPGQVLSCGLGHLHHGHTLGVCHVRWWYPRGGAK